MLTSAGLTVALLAWPRTDPCGSIEQQLGEVWDPPRRAALDERFAAAGVAHADDSRSRVSAALDRWSLDWVEARTRLCRDEQHGRIGIDEAAARGRCLLRQRAQVQSLVEALLDPTAALSPAEAVQAAAMLPTSEACSDAGTMLAMNPPPIGTEAEVEALRRDIDAAAELRLLGRLEPGFLQSEAAHRRALALDYGPALAEATAELATQEFSRGARERGHALRLDAVDLAEASRHDVLAARLWTAMAMQAAAEFADADTGTAYLRRANAAWKRVPPPIEEQAQLAYVQGLLADLDGRSEEAEAALHRAIALLDGGSSTELPAMYLALATLLHRRDPESAWPVYEQAITEAQRIWGPRHPATARYHHHLALARRESGQREAAVRSFETAVEIWSGAFEAPHPPHPLLAAAHQGLVQLAIEAGDLEQAETWITHLDAAQASLPADDPDRANVESLRATLAGLRNQRAEALAHCERALALWLPSVSETDPRVQFLRSEAASHLTALGRLDEAAARYRELLDAGDLDREREAHARLGLAEIELRRGRVDAAAIQLDTLAEAGPVPGGLGLLQALLQA
ncbi:MAG: tetratricopeptide repeat protein, partial [Myxococcales bacterium]|nr:tetratricopeptide repeat protein [Myxococcales bacterium]